MATATKKTLTRAKAPECAGVSSDAVRKAIEHLDSKMNYHSFLVLRHGKVAAECYRYPFAAQYPHIMYSVSKTITATAVGFAIDEGYLRLDTRVIDIFPEYKPKKADEKLDKLEIKHLLTMTAGKVPSYLLNKTEHDWLKHLFDAKWQFEPGEKFEYVNENIFTLCAALQRVTGETVVDFLMPRLFEPLGIDRPFWETDHNGIESGGWGLFLKTEDMAKIMYCYLKQGKYNGKQIIPKNWAIDATLNQSKHAENPVREGGYGYCIWISNENEYRADGMFSQCATVLEKEDAVVCITSCSHDGSAFWEAVQILKEEGFVDENPKAKPSKEYTDFISSRVIDTVPCSERRSPLEEFISGKNISFKKNTLLNTLGFPMSVLTIAAVYMTKYRAGNIDNVRFDFAGNECLFTWQENHEVNSISCGLDGKYRYTPIVLAGTPYTAACAAYWLDNYTLEVHIRPLESLSKRILRFSFQNNNVVMTPSEEPSIEYMISGIVGFVKEMFKQKQLKQAAGTTMKKLETVVEPLHYGKFTD